MTTKTLAPAAICPATYAPGVLVVTAIKGDAAARIPSRSGVILEGPTDDTPNLLVVWFWGLGAPVAGESVHTIFVQEAAPLTATLATMPEAAFETIERGLHFPFLARDLTPVIAAVAAARTAREDAAAARK